MSDASARMLAGLLETRTGQQLQVGRRWRLEMALQPLMKDKRLAGADALVQRIASGVDPGLTERAIDALLNHETSFYRDHASFALFQDKGLARLERARSATKTLRLWCAGCSTGQEAYTLAMIFADDPARWRGWTIDIVATDISAAAIDQARSGRYGHFEIQRGLPVQAMLRWFERGDDDHWQAVPALRGAVRFQRRSLLDAVPAPGRYDAILCRNVLFYFSATVRGVVFGRLAGAMAPDGLLMLGAGETVLGHSEAFVSDFECRGMYRPIVPTAVPRVA